MLPQKWPEAIKIKIHSFFWFFFLNGGGVLVSAVRGNCKWRWCSPLCVSLRRLPLPRTLHTSTTSIPNAAKKWKNKNKKKNKQVLPLVNQVGTGSRQLSAMLGKRNITKMTRTERECVRRWRLDNKAGPISVVKAAHPSSPEPERAPSTSPLLFMSGSFLLTTEHPSKRSFR